MLDGHVAGGYKAGCRCGQCVEKKRVYHREYQRRRRAALGTVARKVPLLAGNDPRHGTLNGYINFFCRCPFCRRAEREYKAARAGRPYVRLTPDEAARVAEEIIIRDQQELYRSGF